MSPKKEQYQQRKMCYLREKADQRLHVVSANWVTNKRHGFPSHDLKKPQRVKNRQAIFAPVRFPFPLDEIRVGSSKLHAVLVFVYRPARRVGVVRCLRVRNPLSREYVTALVWCYDGVLELDDAALAWRLLLEEEVRVFKKRVEKRDDGEESCGNGHYDE